MPIQMGSSAYDLPVANDSGEFDELAKPFHTSFHQYPDGGFGVGPQPHQISAGARTPSLGHDKLPDHEPRFADRPGEYEEPDGPHWRSPLPEYHGPEDKKSSLRGEQQNEHDMNDAVHPSKVDSYITPINEGREWMAGAEHGKDYAHTSGHKSAEEASKVATILKNKIAKQSLSKDAKGVTWEQYAERKAYQASPGSSKRTPKDDGLEHRFHADLDGSGRAVNLGKGVKSEKMANHVSEFYHNNPAHEKVTANGAEDAVDDLAEDKRFTESLHSRKSDGKFILSSGKTKNSRRKT